MFKNANVAKKKSIFPLMYLGKNTIFLLKFKLNQSFSLTFLCPSLTLSVAI